MRTIYIDSDYRCHLINDGTMKAVETDAFDGKCKAYVEGYRLIPEGDSWTREDGSVFVGFMISPAVNFGELLGAQQQYEADQENMSDMETALSILGVSP